MDLRARPDGRPIPNAVTDYFLRDHDASLVRTAPTQMLNPLTGNRFDTIPTEAQVPNFLRLQQRTIDMRRHELRLGGLCL